MITLFVKCHILDDPDDGQNQTLTRLIIQQAMQCPGIRFGEKMHYLWPGTAKHTFDRCIHSLRAVADVALKDLDGEMNGFYLDFTVWDIKAFHLAKKKPPDEWRSFKRLTDLRLKRLICSGLKRPDAVETAQEWWSAAHCLQEDLAAKLDRGEGIDNRAEWRKVLHNDAFSQRATSMGRFRMLPSFINYYLAFRDSSTGAERALAVVERLRKAHLGPLGLTLHDLTEISLDGPQAETELAIRYLDDDNNDVQPVLRATDMSLELVNIWRSHFGARFRLYKTRADLGKVRAKRSGTEASIIRKAAASTDDLVRNADKTTDRTRTILGCKRKDLPQQQSRQDNPQFNQDLEDLYNTAEQKKQKKLGSRNERRDRPHVSVYQPGPLRTAKLIAEPATPLSQAYEYTRKRQAKVMDLTLTGPAVQSDAATVFRPGSMRSMRDTLAFLRGCDVIVVASFKHLQHLPKFNDTLCLDSSWSDR